MSPDDTDNEHGTDSDDALVDAPHDFAALEDEILAMMFVLMRIRLKATVRQRLRDLERQLGHPLPEVRAQLGLLYDETKALPPAEPAESPATPPSGGSPTKRPPGRPKKTAADITSLSSDTPTP